MASRTLILLGTRKGAFILELDAARERATVRGPYCEAMPIQHLAWDPGGARCSRAPAAPGTAPSSGAAPTSGETWTQSGEGLTYGDGEGVPAVSKVWNITPRGRHALRRRGPGRPLPLGRRRA